jgi:hypothetical protein
MVFGRRKGTTETGDITVICLGDTLASAGEPTLGRPLSFEAMRI